MKKQLAVLAIAAFVSPVFAADAENKNETTVDHSKNPITGTETTKVKKTVAKKGPHGEKKSEVVEKTKKYTDGTVEKSVETESDSSTKH